MLDSPPRELHAAVTSECLTRSSSISLLIASAPSAHAEGVVSRIIGADAQRWRDEVSSWATERVLTRKCDNRLYVGRLTSRKR
jgi:hypothetical protein